MSAQVIFSDAYEPYVGVKCRGMEFSYALKYANTGFWQSGYATDLAEEFPDYQKGAKTSYASTDNRNTAQSVGGTTYYPCITVYFNSADASGDITSVSQVQNYYKKDKISVIFGEGYRPAQNGVGTRLHYVEGGKLKVVFRDAKTYSKIGGENCIICDASG